MFRSVPVGADIYGHTFLNSVHFAGFHLLEVPGAVQEPDSHAHLCRQLIAVDAGESIGQTTAADVGNAAATEVKIQHPCRPIGIEEVSPFSPDFGVDTAFPVTVVAIACNTTKIDEADRRESLNRRRCRLRIHLVRANFRLRSDHFAEIRVQ